MNIWRKGWDSNPRGSVNPLAVFKTAALNHSATLPEAIGRRIDGLRTLSGQERGHPGVSRGKNCGLYERIDQLRPEGARTSSSYVPCQASSAPQPDLSTNSVRGISVRMIVQRWERALRRRLTTSYSRVHACPFFVWVCPGLRSGVDLAIGHKDEAGNSPCRGSAPAIARVLSSPDHAPA